MLRGETHNIKGWCVSRLTTWSNCARRSTVSHDEVCRGCTECIWRTLVKKKKMSLLERSILKYSHSISTRDRSAIPNDHRIQDLQLGTCSWVEPWRRLIYAEKAQDTPSIPQRPYIVLAPRTYETEEASTALHKVIIIVVNMISIIIVVVVVVVVVIVVIICIVTIVVIVVMNMNVSTWYSFIIVLLCRPVTNIPRK